MLRNALIVLCFGILGDWLWLHTHDWVTTAILVAVGGAVFYAVDRHPMAVRLFLCRECRRQRLTITVQHRAGIATRRFKWGISHRLRRSALQKKLLPPRTRFECRETLRKSWELVIGDTSVPHVHES